MNTTFANANELVKEIQKIGLLLETTGGKRNRVFSYAAYLALFDESASEER